jgi:hypothetical protein
VTNLESLTLFTTGVRVTVLVFLITAVWSTIRKRTNGFVGSSLSPVVNSPKVLLYAICLLLGTSLLEVGIELYDHWNK